MSCSMAYILCAIATEFPKTTSPYEVNKTLIEVTCVLVSYLMSYLWNPALIYCLENADRQSFLSPQNAEGFETSAQSLLPALLSETRRYKYGNLTDIACTTTDEEHNNSICMTAQF